MRSIREIFDSNIELMKYIDKAVILFRQGRYDEALGMVAESADRVTVVSEAVLGDRVYFADFPEEETAVLLRGILNAKKNKDYILLADLYEKQLSGFVSAIQEYILEREDYFEFDIGRYNVHIEQLERKIKDGLTSACSQILDADQAELIRINSNAALESPLAPEELLDKGYSVEFTSCGLMTLRAPLNEETSIYLHTNGDVYSESFLCADRWRNSGTDTYIVYGLGMGYHIKELLELEKFAKAVVFESDINVIKLFAAFGEGALFDERRFSLVYDPDKTLIEKKLAGLAANEKACVHYPSLRRSAVGERLGALAPFLDIVERC